MRLNWPSCSTCSSLAWVPGSNSPISSRKSVPELANSTRPGLVPTAPVKDPFSYPECSFQRPWIGSCGPSPCPETCQRSRHPEASRSRPQLNAIRCDRGDRICHAYQTFVCFVSQQANALLPPTQLTIANFWLSSQLIHLNC